MISLASWVIVQSFVNIVKYLNILTDYSFQEAIATRSTCTGIALLELHTLLNDNGILKCFSISFNEDSGGPKNMEHNFKGYFYNIKV